jgi:type II secretory pathway component PulF
MQEFLIVLASLVWYAILILVPGLGFSLVLHFLLSLPMRRRDRARFFLDLLASVLDRGQPVEPAIISAAEYHDRAIGMRFFMVAAHIEGGARLGEALAKVPSFLPPQVNAMIRAGEKLGDLKKVLPACREVLRVAPDTVRTTMHYMLGILLVFAPIAIWLISILSMLVVPKFKEVAGGMSQNIWPLTAFIFRYTPELVLLEISIFCVLMLAVIIYLGGPGLVAKFQFNRVPLVDWIAWRVPWKQKKLLRAFSAMLAVLLDGGVPEAEAVRLAGESTANEICRRRAQRVVAALAQGARLEDAVRLFDNNGELHWRLANAIHARGGFLQALRGWHGAMEAKAFQQEETAAHMVTSGLVVLNGVIVGLIAVGMFGLLIMILKASLAAT